MKAYRASELFDDWNPVSDSDINTILASDAPMVRAHVRDLVRNFPFFARAVDIYAAYIVGRGLVPQSKLKKKVAQKIEDYLNSWMDRADISGKLHFYEMQELCIRQYCESGEYLWIEHYSPKKGYQLQAVESDWLPYGDYSLGTGTATKNGISFDPTTGERIAYNFMSPNLFGQEITVPASRVIHGFETKRPGQERGISPFVAGVRLSKYLSEYIGAEVNAAKLAARYLAFVETPDFQLRQSNLETENSKKIDYLEEAIIEYLRPGEKINFANSQRPGSNFLPFIQFCCQIFAITTGIPYELISGSYQDLNYSTARVTRNDFQEVLYPKISGLVRKFCQPVIGKAIMYGVMRGELSLPGFFRKSAYYSQITWHGTGQKPVDQLKESKAQREDMNAYTRSPVEVAAARGRDLGDVLSEFKKAQEMADELNLDIKFVGGKENG